MRDERGVEVRSTGEAIVEALVAHGVDTVFGLPGAHTYKLIDALWHARDRIRFVEARHEQGAAWMAFGHARSTGRPGVFTVVPGPGVLNAGAALCTALGAGAPVLCLTANVMADLIGRGRGQLHELPDQLATLGGITRRALRIDHPSQAPAVMEEAFHAMLSGRPGPVAVEAPWDVMGMRAPVRRAVPRPIERPAPDLDRARAIADAARAASRPLIMVGGGAVGAAAEVRALSERLGAPVTAHRSGKGVLPDGHPGALSMVAAYEWWRRCDLLIGVGSRLELAFMRWRWSPPGLRVARIDVDPTEMVRLPCDLALVADAAEGVAAVLDALDALDGHRGPDRAEELAALRAGARARVEVVQPQMAYLDAIRAALPADGFLVEEVSQMGFTGRLGFPVPAPRLYVSCGYQETLGFGYDTALGVKAAHPGRAVVSMSGDGGFLFGAQELATAVRHRLGVVAVVFDNQGYGNVLRDQRRTYGGRLLGAELTSPDFAALARAFGAHGERADGPEALRRALARAIERDAPAVIHVPVEPGSETSPWPLLHPAPHDAEPDGGDA